MLTAWGFRPGEIPRSATKIKPARQGRFCFCNGMRPEKFGSGVGFNPFDSP